MSYQKQNFIDEQVLTADHMNHIEEGISTATVQSLSSKKNQLLNVAYSSLANTAFYHSNTMEVFLTGIKLGFNAIKCDIHVTSDGEFILCHDRGITLTDTGTNVITDFNKSSSTTEAISNLTYSELKECVYDTESVIGYNSRVCDIDDFLQICKEFNIIPYITLREEFASNYVYSGSNTCYFGCDSGVDLGTYLLTKLLDKLTKYNLLENAYLSAFVHDLKAENFISGSVPTWLVNQYSAPADATKSIVSKLRTLSEKPSAVWVQSSGFPGTSTTNRNELINRIDYMSNLSGNNCISLYLSNDTDNLILLSDIIKYANSKNVVMFNSIVSDYKTHNAMCNLGISGGQYDRVVTNCPIQKYYFTLRSIITENVRNWEFSEPLFSTLYGTSAYERRRVSANIIEDESNNAIIIRDISFNGSNRGFGDYMLKGWLYRLTSQISILSNITANISIVDKEIKVTFPDGLPTTKQTMTIVLDI